MLKKVLALAAASALLPCAVNAQPAAQDWELILTGNGNADGDFDRGGFGAGLHLGHYLNDNLEIVGRQSFNYTGDGNWGGSTRAAVDYNFLMDKLVPFIGGNIGYSYANRGTDSWGFGPEAGIKYYIQEKAFLFGMAEYAMAFRGKTFKDGNWNFQVGIGLNL